MENKPFVDRDELMARLSATLDRRDDWGHPQPSEDLQIDVCTIQGEKRSRPDSQKSQISQVARAACVFCDLGDDLRLGLMRMAKRWNYTAEEHEEAARCAVQDRRRWLRAIAFDDQLARAAPIGKGFDD